MTKKITINCEIEEKWVDCFLSFLQKMETNGVIGHSELLGFYSDGDGSFRPKFTVNGKSIKEEIVLVQPLSLDKEIKIDFYDIG